MARRKFINAKLKGYNELQEILVEDGVFKKIAPSIEAVSYTHLTLPTTSRV